jgi:hypothetical protein
MSIEEVLQEMLTVVLQRRQQVGLAEPAVDSAP